MLVEKLPELLDLGIPIVIVHMARVDPAAGIKTPPVQTLLKLLKSHSNLWIKLLPNRISKMPLDYSDLLPFHRAFLEVAADRSLWGTDWPFVRMGPHTPDAGHLLDHFADWVREDHVRQALLVDNPAKLYGWSS